MRTIIFIVLVTGLTQVISSQILVNDPHKLNYEILPQKNKNMKEIQIYYNTKMNKEKNRKRLGRLQTFARYNDQGNIMDYHKNKRYEFLSDRYRFFYNDGKLFEVQKNGVSDKTIYKWQLDNEGIIQEEMKFDRKNRVKYHWISYVEDSKIIKTEKNNKKNENLYTILYKYNSNNLLSELKYIEDGKMKYSWEFTYDQKGRNIESIKYSPDHSIIESWKIDYTENDDTLAIIKYNKKGVAQLMKYYTYGPDGELLGYKDFNKEDETLNEWRYIYDASKNLNEVHYYNARGIASIKKYKYKDGKINNEKIFLYNGYFDPDYSYSFLKSYKYNSHGDVNEIIEIDTYGTIKSITRYNYIYF